jgi:hypothetical protein
MRRVRLELSLNPFALTSGDRLSVRLAVARGTLELLLMVSVIPSSTRFAAAFEIFAVIRVGTPDSYGKWNRTAV